MKPLSIKEQIEVLKFVLSRKYIFGMCDIICTYCRASNATACIPTFNHAHYLKFYKYIPTVQKRKDWPWWDKDSFFGNLRRRWFIRHLIKELKKQL